MNDALPELARAAYLTATLAQQSKACQDALAIMNGLPWKGRKARRAQPNAWPRKGVKRSDGTPITDQPYEVSVATKLLAGFLLAGIPIDADAMDHIHLALGPLLEEIADARQAESAPNRPVRQPGTEQASKRALRRAEALLIDRVERCGLARGSSILSATSGA